MVDSAKDGVGASVTNNVKKIEIITPESESESDAITALSRPDSAYCIQRSLLKKVDVMKPPRKVEKLALPGQDNEPSTSSDSSGVPSGRGSPHKSPRPGSASEFDSPSPLAFGETTTHKGLTNEVGDNNCFLNVAVQTLWHLGPFRYQIQKLISSRKTSSPKGDNDVLGALCDLFVQYEHTELATLPAQELRRILGEMFSKYRLGNIADANETLEIMLEKIHEECSPECPHGNTKCLAHNVFGGKLLEQATCKACGCTSEPKMRNDFMHYVYAAELIEMVSKQSQTGAGTLRSKFGNLLHECMRVKERSCPSSDQSQYKGSLHYDDRSGASTPRAAKSGASTPKKGKYTSDFDNNEYSFRDEVEGTETGNVLHTRKPSIVTPYEMCRSTADVKVKAVEPPLVLAISVGWTSSKQSVKTLRAFLDLMSNAIQLSDLFDVVTAEAPESAPPSPQRKSSIPVTPSRRASLLSPSRKTSVGTPNRKASVIGKKVFPQDDFGANYIFRGFVCYYGSHYVSIFQDRSAYGNVRFLLFDDQTVRHIGGWEDVKKECIKCLYQPVLLLYELESAEIIATKCVVTQPFSKEFSAANSPRGDSPNSSHNTSPNQSSRSSSPSGNYGKQSNKDSPRLSPRDPADTKPMTHDQIAARKQSLLIEKALLQINTKEPNISPGRIDSPRIADFEPDVHDNHNSDFARHPSFRRSCSPPQSRLNSEKSPNISQKVLRPETKMQTQLAAESFRVRSPHERPNSSTGYALQEIFNQPSCDSTNTNDHHHDTTKNPLFTKQQSEFKAPPPVPGEGNYIQHIEIFKKRLLVQKVVLPLNTHLKTRPKHRPKGFMRAFYELSFPAEEEEKNIIGIEHDLNKKGHIVVIGFAKHPDRGGKYIAEKSGKIQINDRILSVEGRSLHKLSKDEVKTIVADHIEEEGRETLTLEIESFKKTAAWFVCPYCHKENRILDHEEQELKAIRQQIIADHDNIGLKRRLFEEYKGNSTANNLHIQSENENGKEHILEFHFSKKLLCYCVACKYPSSASNLFHSKLIE